MPPPGGMPGIGGVSFLGLSATIASVVTSSPAIEAASCSVSDDDTYAYGYDAQEGKYGDLVSKGIIDPTKVVRQLSRPRQHRRRFGELAC
jgi:hypothetical protein